MEKLLSEVLFIRITVFIQAQLPALIRMELLTILLIVVRVLPFMFTLHPFNGNSANYFARINSDGSLDNTFATGTGPGSNVNSASMQADGRIIIGGNFTSYNGTGRNRIARINNELISINSINVSYCQGDNM